MIRPFKNIEELQTKTAIFVGDVLPIRVKQDIFPKELYFHKWLVTELNFSNKTVGLGTHLYPLEDLYKNFEFQKDNKWQSFGVEVPEETENKKNAKFKVGHMYKDADKDGVFMVTAKYTSPHDNKTYLIIQRLSLHQIGQIICLIRKDENEDEFIDRYTVDYRSVKCSAKDEVEKIEKEIPLY